MAGVRIKDLQSAKPVVEQNFDDFKFVVDAPEPDATLKLSGAELKEAVGVKKHTHPLEKVDSLPGELVREFESEISTRSRLICEIIPCIHECGGCRFLSLE